MIALAKEFELKTTISRGKVRSYLGMDLDFGTSPGTMIISMIKYLQKTVDEFPEVLRGTKACLAGNNLFKVQDAENRELLSEEMANISIERSPSCCLSASERGQISIF